ncbi:cell division protein FtsH [Candidatus Epulonipiscium fishelsonii]|uniref:Cell division protein FtsH n=1 Tax=Candidatus Epulonipiscium fishelsonii TaxID=77094 RepID=A0ACC8XDS1_9FIRM|nr:cell division protein FtsH [Epulopiscium sp. SCG-B05WGA-EpuloA1]ONI41023.1 cell division protein FtsH [Epulopiscium sp. SCG-B11WGA-EpuloA1]ONI47401.1 cell division protein FtsH [Epulopiscium sp. SCG-C06WGA-EpuloA1]
MSKKTWIYNLVLCIVGSMIVGLMLVNTHAEIQVPYQEFNKLIEENKVTQVTLGDGQYIEYLMNDNDEIIYKTENPRSEDLKENLLLNGIKVEESSANLKFQFAQSLFGLLIFGGVFFFVFKQISSGQKDKLGFSVEAVSTENIKISFSNIAGNVEAKEQVQDIVDFIKEPEKYTKVGARMPKGLIFYGPPGTGKTMMAKALAKEANVPFFSVNGSDFMQMYVGVGASRIRDLFKEARKTEKAVIFIDEIDAIGKKRSQFAESGNNEKDQTLNALLTEMSGFNDEEGIVVIAATNRLELLDEALLRPGRFDRHIQIGYPDKKARKLIFNAYIKNKPVDANVDIDRLSEDTIYFTGAMIESLVNEAAIEAAKNLSSVLKVEHFEKAYYTVIAGAEKKDRSNITKEDKEITAYHEAGHTITTSLLAPKNKITKVTIIPSTKGMGGFSMNIPAERMYQSKKDILTQIKILLAGRIAEEIQFGNDHITNGASNDIERATTYIKDLVGKYGMEDSIGFLNLELLEEKGEITKIAKKMIQDLYEETKTLLLENKRCLDALANGLLTQETLNEEEIHRIINEATSLYSF